MLNEREILADPSASHWLKSQLVATKSRDVVDAINDAEVLLNVLQQRFMIAVESAGAATD